MKKWKKLYWIPHATYFIDLMLEDLEKNILVYQHKILNSKKDTTYIYFSISFISLLQHFTNR